jgi:hypothetical protein
MKPILKYDPEFRNHHHSSLYCMVKGDHVYTLNNNLKELQQKSDEEQMILKASENYYNKADAAIPSFKMINGIDDIIRIIEELGDTKDNTEIKVIHKDNNLTELVIAERIRI